MAVKLQLSLSECKVCFFVFSATKCICVHSCSFVFIRVHLCSFVFIHARSCSAFNLLLYMRMHLICLRSF